MSATMVGGVLAAGTLARFGADGAHVVLAALLSKTTNAICTIATEHHPQVKSVLEELDIHTTLRVVGALLHDIPQEVWDDGSATSEVLLAVKEIVETVHADIENVRLAQANHDSKWFKSWRSTDYEALLAALVSHKGVMDHRVDLLLKVLPMSRFLAHGDFPASSHREAEAGSGGQLQGRQPVCVGPVPEGVTGGNAGECHHEGSEALLSSVCLVRQDSRGMHMLEGSAWFSDNETTQRSGHAKSTNS